MTETQTPTIESVALGSPIPRVDYVNVNIKDIIIDIIPASQNKPASVEHMEIVGIGDIEFTDRFMNSFTAAYGISKSTFNLFSPEEVIERIVDVGKGDKIRVALEKNKHGYRALAATKGIKPVVESLDIWKLLKELKVDDSNITYCDGVVQSEHQTSITGTSLFEVAGDDMQRRFVMDIPIDGWGFPSVYLMLIREICKNGAVAMSPAFKSSLKLGVGNNMPTLKKFIDAHNDERGFHILTTRFNTARVTPASLDEFYRLYKALGSPRMAGIKCADVIGALNWLAGPTAQQYGLINLNDLPQKRRSLVPLDCSVYDLINLTSELCTHHVTTMQSRYLQGFIGDILSNENGFDLEGAKIDSQKTKDFYLPQPSMN